MIHALREISSICELVADVANELICREISSISMKTSLIQKNSPEAKNKKRGKKEGKSEEEKEEKKRRSD